MERKTSWEGRFLHFIPKTTQARGNAGSQLTLKYRHCRQLGAWGGGSSEKNGAALIAHLTHYSPLDYSSIIMKKLAGVPASPGIVIGKAFAYAGNDLGEIPRYALTEDQVEPELRRLEAAFEAAGSELKALHTLALQETGREQSDIVAAHIMMLEDPDFWEQVTFRIRTSLENAEWAVWDAARILVQTIMASSELIFQERGADINDVSKRILNHLLMIKRVSLADLDQEVILVVRDLLPSEILTMNKACVKGIVMDMGGLTSHTAILSRTFNIPAVLGLATATREIGNDDTLIVDGFKGEVVIKPTQKTMEKYSAARTRYQKQEGEFSELKDLPGETKDGCRVVLKANIEIPEECETALRYGAEGIGLYRSEVLFLSSGKAVDEEGQTAAYSKTLKAMGNFPVTIRTVDLGGDKILPNYEIPDEKNPLLGWRAIRFSLAWPDIFKTQLRAILRASVNGNARIMFPLISGLEELEQALALLEEAKEECRKKGQAYDENIQAGIMIEVPSAAMTADILAKKSGFFSIGTNDLVQYSLAVDRGNERVNYLARPSHPAVIRFIKAAIDAAHRQGIKAAMCGEMAGDPLFTPLLLGLGLDEFSMNAPSIPPVKKCIRKLTLKKCQALAEEVLRGDSAAKNTQLLESWTQ